MEFISPIELGLEGELPHEGFVIAPLTPQHHIGLGDDPFTEIQLAKVHQNFLDDGLVHSSTRSPADFLSGARHGKSRARVPSDARSTSFT